MGNTEVFPEFLLCHSRGGSDFFYGLHIYTPFYHDEYKTTPIYTVREWLEGKTADTYIVIKADHPPIDVTGIWLNWYNIKDLSCCMITTEQDLYTQYGESQGKDMINFYDRKMRNAE